MSDICDKRLDIDIVRWVATGPPDSYGRSINAVALAREVLDLRLEVAWLRNISDSRGEENDRMRNMLADSIVVHHDDQAETARLAAREGQLEAQVEVLEITISRLRNVCDAAYSVVRDDGAEDGWTTWQELVSALEDNRYEPRADCDGPDCERQGAVIVHRPSCVRWEP